MTPIILRTRLGSNISRKKPPNGVITSKTKYSGRISRQLAIRAAAGHILADNNSPPMAAIIKASAGV